VTDQCNLLHHIIVLILWPPVYDSMLLIVTQCIVEYYIVSNIKNGINVVFFYFILLWTLKLFISCFFVHNYLPINDLIVWRWRYGVYRHFQQYFNYIMTVSFIGRGNQSTHRKTTDLPHVTDKHYHIMLNQVHLTMSGDRCWLHR